MYLVLVLMMQHFTLSVWASGTTAKEMTGKWFFRVEDGDIDHLRPGLARPQMTSSGVEGKPLPWLPELEGLDPAGYISQDLPVGFPLVLEGTGRKSESGGREPPGFSPCIPWDGFFSCSCVSFLGPVSLWTGLLCGEASVWWPWPWGLFRTSFPLFVSPTQVWEPLPLLVFVVPRCVPLMAPLFHLLSSKYVKPFLFLWLIQTSALSWSGWILGDNLDLTDQHNKTSLTSSFLLHYLIEKSSSVPSLRRLSSWKGCLGWNGASPTGWESRTSD